MTSVQPITQATTPEDHNPERLTARFVADAAEAKAAKERTPEEQWQHHREQAAAFANAFRRGGRGSEKTE